VPQMSIFTVAGTSPGLDSDKRGLAPRCGVSPDEPGLGPRFLTLRDRQPPNIEVRQALIAHGRQRPSSAGWDTTTGYTVLSAPSSENPSSTVVSLREDVTGLAPATTSPGSP
jgi:hypothetical protein